MEIHENGKSYKIIAIYVFCLDKIVKIRAIIAENWVLMVGLKSIWNFESRFESLQC